MGVMGMRLNEGDEVIGMQMNTQGDYLLVVSENGMGKCTEITEFSPQYRAGKGVLCYKITEKSGSLVGAKLVHRDYDIIMITTGGIVIRIAVGDISVIGRNTSGVKLMNIDPNSDVKVACIAKVHDGSSQSEEQEIEDAIGELMEEENSDENN
jgi:DNA gyrase subunit A